MVIFQSLTYWFGIMIHFVLPLLISQPLIILRSGFKIYLILPLVIFQALTYRFRIMIHFVFPHLISQLLIILRWGFVVYTLSLLSYPCTVVNRPVSGHPCAQSKCQTADTRTNSATRLTRTCSQNHATSALPYPADLQQCVSSSVASAASTAGISGSLLGTQTDNRSMLWPEYIPTNVCSLDEFHTGSSASLFSLQQLKV